MVRIEWILQQRPIVAPLQRNALVRHLFCIVSICRRAWLGVVSWSQTLRLTKNYVGSGGDLYPSLSDDTWRLGQAVLRTWRILHIMDTSMDFRVGARWASRSAWGELKPWHIARCPGVAPGVPVGIQVCVAQAFKLRPGPLAGLPVRWKLEELEVTSDSDKVKGRGVALRPSAPASSASLKFFLLGRTWRGSRGGGGGVVRLTQSESARVGA